MNTELALLLRVAAAGVFAGALGWEREHAGKAAGLRTHMVLGMGSALFAVVGERMVLLGIAAADPSALRFDPLRLVEAIATGVGFLGAGTIIFAAGESRVRGLTTAANLWATAAIGLATGLGYYRLAGGATVLLLIVLHVLMRFEASRASDSHET